MTANGNTILFRYTNPGDDYRSVGFTDKIEMDIGVIPDATGHTKESRWIGDVSLQENPQPTQNKPHDIQDLGVATMTAELVGFAENPPTQLVTNTILTWYSQPKQNTNYPFGRFGILTKDMETFNSEPTATYGYNFGHFEIIRTGEYPKIDLILQFKYNGAITGLGVIRT